MPYLQDIYQTSESIKSRNHFFDLNFSEELLEKADRLEWWASSFLDPGPDWNEWKLYHQDELLDSKIVDGY